MPRDITIALRAMGSGDQQAAEEVMPLVYEELRKQASGYLQNESSGHTLQATALVNEAFLKLCGQKKADWRSRTQFFYVGSQAMRRILVDHARSKGRQKRGGQMQRVVLRDEAVHATPPSTDVLGLHEAIEKLSRRDNRLAKIVEMRYFGGMTEAEVAEALELSVSTIQKDWKMIRAWLRRELSTSAE